MKFDKFNVVNDADPDAKANERVNNIKTHSLWFLFLIPVFFIPLLFQTLLGIALIGVIVFSGVLILGNILSPSGDLSTGEVRRSIAISFIFIFFALLAFGDKITIDCENKMISKVLENFWVFIVTIIAFYFGGRSLEKAAEKKGNNNSSEQESGGTV